MIFRAKKNAKTNARKGVYYHDQSFFAEAQELHTRFLCNIYIIHIFHMFLLWTSSSAPHFSGYTPTFSKNKEKHAKKDSYKWNPYKWGDLTQLPIYFRPFIAVKSPHQMAGQESSEIAIHPLLHRSIQRIQRHHKAHDDLQADLRPHLRLLSPRETR